MITTDDLVMHDTLPDVYTTHVVLGTTLVGFVLQPQSLKLLDTIALANRICFNFETFHVHAIQQIIATFLVAYNQDDNKLRRPKLTPSGFTSNLSLKSIRVLGTSDIDFFFDENGMFQNRSLVAHSADGYSFSKATLSS